MGGQEEEQSRGWGEKILDGGGPRGGAVRVRQGGGGGGQRPLEVCDWLAAGQKNNTAATAGTKLTPFHLCHS